MLLEISMKNKSSVSHSIKLKTNDTIEEYLK